MGLFCDVLKVMTLDEVETNQMSMVAALFVMLDHIKHHKPKQLPNIDYGPGTTLKLFLWHGMNEQHVSDGCRLWGKIVCV